MFQNNRFLARHGNILTIRVLLRLTVAKKTLLRINQFQRTYQFNGLEKPELLATDNLNSMAINLNVLLILCWIAVFKVQNINYFFINT